MRHRPGRCQTPRRRRGRCALPPGRHTVCGRNADLHSPRVSVSGYRARCLGGLQTLVGAARRRRFAPSAQEPSGANRRCSHRRTRPKAGGRSGDEHTTTSDPPQAGRWRRSNQRLRLLTKRRSEPFPRQKDRRPLHGSAGAPRGKEKGARGERKTRKRLSFSRTARAKNVCRAHVKTGSGRYDEQSPGNQASVSLNRRG